MVGLAKAHPNYTIVNTGAYICTGVHTNTCHNFTWSSNHHYTSLSTTNRVISYYWECVGSHWGQVSDSITSYSVISCSDIWRACNIIWTWHNVVHYGIKIIKWFSPTQCEGYNDPININSVDINCYIRNHCRNTCN